MKRADVLKALEGHENALGPAVKAHEEYFAKLHCYECGGPVLAFVNPQKLFREDAVLPNFLARCRTCGLEFEPYTKIQVNVPGTP